MASISIKKDSGNNNFHGEIEFHLHIHGTQEELDDLHEYIRASHSAEYIISSEVSSSTMAKDLCKLLDNTNPIREK
jgi:hypothetical protein